MTKRTQRTRPNSSAVQTTSSGAATDSALEQRVLAFAEQLGRIAGTVQAKTSRWMNDDTLKDELARVRDGAADLLTQLTGGGTAVAQKPVAAAAVPGPRKRSGGVVDAPGKKHRSRMPSDPDESHVRSQAAKMRAAKTMVKTNRRRGRG
jgi:hypothetical protein